MAGNTRGKLKEHLEGIHKNCDWSIKHVNESLQLIQQQLSFTEPFIAVKDNPEETQKLLMQNKVYQAFVSIGEIVQIVDSGAQSLYGTI